MSYNFHPTSVDPAGLTALIQNLGRDCTPSQYVREFVKNSIEACQRVGGNRRIEVDFDIELYRQHKQYKIAFTDDGDGMSEEQMQQLLNNLSASGGRNVHRNYGVGAKISAMTRNHEGIFYQSWRNSIGNAMVIFYNEEQQAYGIKGLPKGDGTTSYTVRVPQHIRPKLISEHGTRVTLLGMTPSQDTMLQPEGIPGAKESWIYRFLTARFFRVPENIELLARIGYDRDITDTKHNYLRRVKGQKAVLDEKCSDCGELQLKGAKAYWWIMPADVDGHGRELVKGHCALVNQDEVFEISDARSSRLAYFGVIFGRDRVVIYLEPEHAVQNTARTGLVQPNGSPLRWDDWQDEFRENIPKKLRELIDDLSKENSKDSHSDSIRERLKSLKELFRISRYRRAKTGDKFANPDTEVPLGTSFQHVGHSGGRASEGSQGMVSGLLATSLLSEIADADNGVLVQQVAPDPFPQFQWDSETEALKDRAAEYVSVKNLIVGNRDFQGLKDLIAHFSKNYQDSPMVLPIIEDTVREAFEQILIESVAGALSFKNRQHWDPDESARALSKEALSTVVMQRYWMCSHIKRNLGNKIKGFGESMAASSEAA